jgi:phytoene desaturase
VEELFKLMGDRMADHLRYRRLEMICRYFWPDGSRLDVPDDPLKFAEKVAAFSGMSVAKTADYLAIAEKLYGLAAPLFLDRPFPTRKGLLSPEGKAIGMNPGILDPYLSLHRRNARSFDDRRMVQLFDRYATYNGSNPYKAPATLKMIAHLEHNLGAFFPEEGMYSIARGLYNLSVRHGVKYHFENLVERIILERKPLRISGIRANGKVMEYSLVVSDVDFNTLYRKRVLPISGPLAGRGQQMSTSALIFYWGVRGRHPELALHNILFSDDYREEFRCLFDSKRLPDDPTVYIFISCREVESDAPAGHENWFVMINAPENNGQDWDSMIPRLRARIMEKIKMQTGIDLKHLIIFEHIEDPRTIETRTGSWHGSLYGTSSNSRMSAFSRHRNHRGKVAGLYFTGGSVHPGGGIPLCLASAKIVAELLKD